MRAVFTKGNTVKSFRYCLVVLFFISPLTWADSSLCVSNNSPFHQFHFIPCLTRVSQSNSFQLAISSERSNIFYYDEAGLLSNEKAVVDGEVNHQRFLFEKKMNSFLLGAEVTQVGFSKGSWDSAIEDWHGAFNFVNWDRENYPQNELMYRYQSEDAHLTVATPQKYQRLSYHIGFAFNDSNIWLNNIRLGRVNSTGNQLVAPATSWVSFQSPLYHLSGAQLINANFGVSHSEKNGVLAEVQKPWLYFGSLNYEYRWYQSLNLLLSLSGNTAHYDSESVVLGKPASQMAAALAWGLTRESQLSIAIVEDIQIGASPDVTLQVAYRYKSH